MLFMNQIDMPDDNLVVYNGNKSIPFENLFEYTGVLLTGTNLDDQLTRIQHEIMTNLDAHSPVSRMRRDKNMLGQINKDRMVIIFERYIPTKITVCPVSIRKVKHVLLKMIHIRFDIFPGNKVFEGEGVD